MVKRVKTNSTTFTQKRDETVLEGLERAGHDVDYQCRSGYCGSCLVRKTSGQVHYPNRPLAYIPQGYILACCAIPVTDIELDVAIVALKYG